jgi:acetyltransferase-like isoleucine patch superfamily enzyme
MHGGDGLATAARAGVVPEVATRRVRPTWFLRLCWFLDRAWSWLYTRLIRGSFGSFGARSKVFPPFSTAGTDGIHIGDNVWIARGGWIQTVPEYAGVRHRARLTIGDGCQVGRFVHITAARSVTIGKGVLIADRVFISDSNHGYADPTRPIFDQPLTDLRDVVVGDHSWLGENVCVLSGVRIGRSCVIGCNAVVTRDIPDESIAVGIPARVIGRVGGKS